MKISGTVKSEQGAPAGVIEVHMKSGPIRPLHTLKGLFSDDGDWAAKAKIQAALGML